MTMNHQNKDSLNKKKHHEIYIIRIIRSLTSELQENTVV